MFLEVEAVLAEIETDLDKSIACDTQTQEAAFEEAVRTRAYYLWDDAGRPEGDGVEYWLEAQRQLANWTCCD